jgi:hypothetical protein
MMRDRPLVIGDQKNLRTRSQTRAEFYERAHLSLVARGIDIVAMQNGERPRRAA